MFSKIPCLILKGWLAQATGEVRKLKNNNNTKMWLLSDHSERTVKKNSRLNELKGSWPCFIFRVLGPLQHTDWGNAAEGRIASIKEDSKSYSLTLMAYKCPARVTDILKLRWLGINIILTEEQNFLTNKQNISVLQIKHCSLIWFSFPHLYILLYGQWTYTEIWLLKHFSSVTKKSLILTVINFLFM